LDSWNKIEFLFCFKLHIPPSELERLEFYRIHYLLKEYEDHVERENKEYEKQQKEAGKQSSSSTTYKPPKMSDYGDYKMPKFDVPKFNMPKFNMPKP